MPFSDPIGIGILCGLISLVIGCYTLRKYRQEIAWWDELAYVILLLFGSLIGYACFRLAKWRCDKHGSLYKVPISRE